MSRSIRRSLCAGVAAIILAVTPFAAIAAGRSYTTGAQISSVRTGSLGERLGLLPSDIVVGMNGRAIGDSADLARALLAWRSAVGTKVEVFRGGRYRHLTMPQD